MSAIRLTVSNVYLIIVVRAMDVPSHTVRIVTMARNTVSSGVENVKQLIVSSVKLRM